MTLLSWGDPPEVLAARAEEFGPALAKILIVGEHNPYGAHPEYALYPDPLTSAGGRLPGILEIPAEALKRTWRTNLCPRGWSAPEALRRATLLLEATLLRGSDGRAYGRPWDAYLLLGSRVRGAFQRALGRATDTKSQPAVLEWSECDRHFLAIPHPSGRSRRWNEPGMRGAAARAFERLVARSGARR